MKSSTNPPPSNPRSKSSYSKEELARWARWHCIEDRKDERKEARKRSYFSKNLGRGCVVSPDFYDLVYDYLHGQELEKLDPPPD